MLNTKTLHCYGHVYLFLQTVHLACDCNNIHRESKATGVRGENHCCSIDPFSSELSENRLHGSILRTQFQSMERHRPIFPRCCIKWLKKFSLEWLPAEMPFSQNRNLQESSIFTQNISFFFEKFLMVSDPFLLQAKRKIKKYLTGRQLASWGWGLGGF